MKKIALIPARVESKRFYGKLLKKLSGVPIILRTYQSALKTNVFDKVYVVTDSDQIIDLLKAVNGNYLKSSSDHESGTDRIAEVATDLEYDIIVNLQGDEPFIDKLSIEKLVNEFNDKEVQMASLMRNFNDKDELDSSLLNQINLYIKKNNSIRSSNVENLEPNQETLEIINEDYYYSNVIARASKTMFECKTSKAKFKSTGTEG